jgi:uncharacterized protein HemX
MTWWGILIIIAVVAIAVGVIVYLLNRSKAMTAEALDKSAQIELETAKKRAALAAQVARRAEQEKKQLAARLKTINTWFLSAREQIAKEKQDEYKVLAGDPDALDSKLDALLGRSGRN